MLKIRNRFFLLIAIMGLALSFTACTKSDDYVKVSFDSEEYIIKVGESWDIQPIISKGSAVKDVTIEYSSSNAAVASYENGVLKGLELGETIIKIVCEEQPIAYDTATVYVVEYRLPTVEFSSLEPVMLKKDTQQLSYEFLPVNYGSQPVEFQASVSYASANEDVAVVDENGLITAVGVGHAVIIARVSEADSSDYRDYTFELDVIESDFKVNYELDGGENNAKNPEAYNVLDLPVALHNPSKENYNFLGWYDNAEFEGEAVTSIPKDQYGDYNLYAKWELAVFDITYELDGGTNASENPAQYNINYLPLVLAEPTKEGHEFEGWLLNGEVVTEVSADTRGAITLVADWYNPEAVLAINYNLDGGTNPSDAPATFVAKEGLAALPTPTKLGYTFAGWYSDSAYANAISSIEVGLEEAISVYAKWDLNKYTVTYNLNEGVFVVYDSIAEIAAEFLADYEAFYGVTELSVENFYGKSATYGLYGFFKDAELSAKWGWMLDYLQANAQKTSYYKAADLSIATVPALFNPAVRANVAALLQETKINSASPVSMDFAKVAKDSYFWSSCPAVEQTVYEYSVEETPVALLTPHKAGYEFAGWYESEDFSGEAVTSVASSDLGDKVYYAKWVAVE